jgi:hypothetical protein
VSARGRCDGLAQCDQVTPWSLTSLREKLIKIGAKVVSHVRYITFQMAEVAVSRPATGTTCTRMRSQRRHMRQVTTAEVRLDAVGAVQSSAPAWSIGGFESLLPRRALLPIAQVVQKGDPGAEHAGHLANVGLV